MTMTPKISFVTAGRNDNFGGRYLERLQNSINSIIVLGNKYNLNFELIFVEWNPPADRARIKDVISWPKETKPGQVRILEVPNEIHKNYKRWEKIPFFEFPAKNAGIRRARGEYILATNSDIVFGEEIIKFLAEGTLSPDAFYRTNRYDIMQEIDPLCSVEEAIKIAENNIYRAQTIEGPRVVARKDRIKEATIDRLKRVNPKKLKEKIVSLSKKISVKKEEANNEFDFAKTYTGMRGLFIHCGGDFMMMHRDHWARFHSYPEVGMDRGIDCYMTIMCHIGGLLQVVLPQTIYHQEHDRSEQYLRPTAVLEDTPQYVEMLKTGKPVPVNDEGWGMKNRELEEIKVIE